MEMFLTEAWEFSGSYSELFPNEKMEITGDSGEIFAHHLQWISNFAAHCYHVGRFPKLPVPRPQ